MGTREEIVDNELRCLIVNRAGEYLLKNKEDLPEEIRRIIDLSSERETFCSSNEQNMVTMVSYLKEKLGKLIENAITFLNTKLRSYQFEDEIPPHLLMISKTLALLHLGKRHLIESEAETLRMCYWILQALSYIPEEYKQPDIEIDSMLLVFIKKEVIRKVSSFFDELINNTEGNDFSQIDAIFKNCLIIEEICNDHGLFNHLTNTQPDPASVARLLNQ